MGVQITIKNQRRRAWPAKHFVHLVAAISLLPFFSASADTEVKAVDVKQVQGTWRGKQTDRFGTGEVEWVIVGGDVTATVVSGGVKLA